MISLILGGPLISRFSQVCGNLDFPIYPRSFAGSGHPYITFVIWKDSFQALLKTAYCTEKQLLVYKIGGGGWGAGGAVGSVGKGKALSSAEPRTIF